MNPTLSTTEIERILKLARAARLERSAPETAPIVPVERGGRLALSFAQQRLWFLEQLGELGGTYHISMRLQLQGALDRAALARALERIVARHESLRTVFVRVDGEPEQRIVPVEESRFGLVEHDLRGEPHARAEVERIVAREADAPFDLERGPLVRAALVRLADDDHLLLVTLHHVVSDAWSMGVFTRELSTLYTAFSQGHPDPLPALPVQYADYAAWQRRLVKGEVLEAQAAYWTRTLAGAPELLELPTDRARPARQDHAGAVLRVELDRELTAALTALGHRHDTTLYMTLLAGWAVVLARLSGQDDVVVGTPSANRTRPEVEELIGFFVNTLALRVDLSAGPTVAELLAQVKTRAMEGQRNQDIPFEQVVDRLRPARSLAYSPLFQVVFAWQDAGGSRALELPGLTLAPTASAPRVNAKFDLLLSLWEQDGRITGAVEYAVSLFERETVERWLVYLRRVLEEMAADDSKPVGRLELLGDAERARLLALGEGAAPELPRATVDALFAQAAAAVPRAVALAWDDGRMTYAEMDERANRLAHHLRRAGVAAGTRVGVCLERGPELVVATLAVLKAGGAYVPLDPSYPAERLAFMVADSAVLALVTESPLADRLPPHAARVVRVDADAAAIAAEPADAPAAATDSEAAAYVMYTSGSTGRPKGVEVPHRAIVRLVRGQDYVSIDPSDVFLQLAPASFDAATLELWGPLLNGARLAIHPAGQPSVESIGRALAEHGVTVLWLTAGLFHLVVDERIEILRGVRQLLAGGDVLSVPHVRRVLAELPETALVNGYGPTENTVFTCCQRIAEAPPEGASIPVGRPIANTYVRVLDAGMQPAPVGVPGELYAGGAGLALGYLNQPERTAETFVADPFAPGARLYRTGDRVRWRADGTVEFLGRVDTQVKVRGYRIEPGEIEARLLEHAGVRGAVVTVREDAPGDRRLVAYYLADEPVAVDALKAHLSGRLPGYMVPAAYVWMDTYPLTPNGKVDRRALPAPEGDAYAAHEYAAPASETEAAVAAIWAELLGAERVGRRDQFFELGGHSLLAVRVVSRVRQVLGVEAELGDLFVRPVLADFARGLETAARAEAPAITPVNRSAAIPLSFAQQRLWFLERLGDMGSTYHIPARLRLHGELDRDALAGALDRIVARHETLRTTFAEVDGVPHQRIAPAEASGFTLVQHDLSGAAGAEAELRRLLSDEARAPFDLERGPLIRGRLVRLAADDHVLLVTMHHIVSDGWSLGVLVGELSALYAALAQGSEADLPGLPVQYADYAAWQRGWVASELLERQGSYWERTLAGAPELLELPTDRARPQKQDFAGGSVDVELDEALTAALKALSHRHGATLFMTLLAGWATVLARLSGQDDVVVGTPSANRRRREIEELIGFFVNTLPLRVDLSGAPTVADLLGQVRARALEAQRNQDIPFEQVVERVRPVRSLGHHPLFQVVFAWQNAPDVRPDLPALRLEAVPGPAHETAKFDLTLTLAESGDRIAGGLNYATALFEREKVERWAGYLRRVLQEMAADEHRPVGRLALVPESERSRVLEEWNATGRPYPAGTCVHELFAAQAARTPEAVALSWHGERWTYAELEVRANRLANALRRRGVGPEVRVGICLPRTPDLVAAMLGVLGAGGAYVPLDPAYPRERLGYMLEDAGITLVITESALAERLQETAAALLLLDRERDALAVESAAAPESGAGPENLSHVIFTSGSTGRPKGVMIRHASVAVLLHWLRENVTDQERSSVLFSTSINFDVSIAEVFGTLAWGGTLVLVENALELATVSEPVVYASMVPSAAAELLRSGGIPGSVRTLNLGGEALPHALAQGLYALPGIQKVGNLYGPTEDTTYSTYHLVPRGADQVLVGRPVANTQAYVLDRHLQPVPMGVAGELYLAGDGLSRGYANHPAMTAERFVPNPFGPAGSRMYRVMDRVRWRERACVDSVPADSRADAPARWRTAVLEYLGRTDLQVKVRGYRIEPGEIEARLAEHPGVREAVVLAREDTPGDRRLVAYVVGDDTAGAEALRAHLGETLPAYMVPAAYVRLEQLPRTPNGKLDRGALAAPDGDAYGARAYEAPVGKVEQALAGIWAELLGVERVGRGDDFFMLGGHSILAVQLISRVRKAMEVELALAALFENPVLSALADRILDLRLARFDPETLARLAQLVRGPGAETA